MSVRNMIHGIKGVKLASRSRRVVDQDGSLEGAAAEDGLKQSSWAQIPQELLREVLLRIEASESVWPMRKHVVFCAGVCRSWRAITKELVKTPEVSGRLTFPISVKQPGPRESLLYCFIKRNRSTQTYYLYLGLTQALAEDGKFLLSARKCRRATCTDYVILLHADGILKGANTYIGKLRSNFLGTKFTVYDGQPPHAGARMSKSRSIKLTGSPQLLPRALGTDHPVAHISYELNLLGSSRGPRKMECVIDSIPASAIEPGGTAPTQTEFHPNTQHASLSFPFLRSRSNRVEGPLSGPLPTARKDGALVLRNKAPRWQEQLQCWCLNFHGRVTVASVKNFQLVASSEHEHGRVMLQFGKVGKNVFTMDYRYPISAFQAFAICLSSFDTKIACER